MYLVLPALFAFSRRYRTVVPLLLIWTACVIGSVVWMPRLGTFYDMPLYIPCFIAGTVGYKYGWDRPARLSFALWPVAMVIVSLLYLEHASISSSWACCLGLGLLIPMFHELPDGFPRMVVRLMARYSYGIYLSHFICIWLAFVACSAIARPAQWLIFFTSLFALPVAMYHTIEAPMISLGARLIRQSRIARELRLAALPSQL
jgi:peptidoglycan/LPS O-acetylase OafA/YrhL